MSWRRPRSPVTIVVGRPLAWAAPMPEETRPSMPLAPRLQRKRARSRPAAGSLLVADRHARGGVDEVAVAWAAPSARWRAGSVTARRRRSSASIASPAACSASSRSPRRRPLLLRAGPPSRRPARSGRRAAAPRPGSSARSSRRGVDDDLVGAARRQPGRAAACWSASRRSAGPGRGRPSCAKCSSRSSRS